MKPKIERLVPRGNAKSLNDVLCCFEASHYGDVLVRGEEGEEYLLPDTRKVCIDDYKKALEEWQKIVYDKCGVPKSLLDKSQKENCDNE